MNPDGSFTYTPDADFAGADSFTYTASDGQLTSNTATVSITVTAVNDAPVAADDAFTVNEDQTLTGDVLANDSDIDTTGLTAALVTGPTNGALALNPDGSFTYTPDADFAGADSFTYTASDGQLTSNTATVSITVTAVNDAPVAADDAFTVNEDQTLTGDVLANDSDIDTTGLTAALVTGPTNGALALNPDGSFTYTPDADFAGADSFTYTASDGQLTSNTATVSITVTAVNDAPVAADIDVQVAEDNSVLVDLSSAGFDVDGDAFSVAVTQPPSHGSLVDNGDGTVTYTPDADFAGADSFTYTATDGQLTSNTATVSITVTAVNDAPVAADIDVQRRRGQLRCCVDLSSAGFDVGWRCVQRGGDPTTQPRQLCVDNGDGTVHLHPRRRLPGADSFTYTATDGQLTSNTATVSITVTAVNDAPVAADDAFTINEDQTLTGDVLANDTDIDTTGLTAALVTGPTNGTLALNPDGSFTYTPDADFTGADSFTYTANDGQLTSNTATVSITVTAVNDAPVAADDAFTANEDQTLTGDVLANDTDIDTTGLTAALVTGPTNGTLAFNPDGSFTYTPDADFAGADSFTYTANDGQLTSNTATVSITVTAVNDAPVAADDAFTANEDHTLTGDVLANDTDIDTTG